MKRAAFLFLFTLSLFSVALVRLDRFFFKHNKSFCLRYIYSTLPFKKNWEVEEAENESIKKILSQKFHYFAKGKQSFVFISEDEQYVLKFHRVHTTLRPLPWLNHPLIYFKKKCRDKKRMSNLAHLQETFNSFKTAFLHLKNEAAVVFIHLNPTTWLKQPIHIIDALGISYTVESDRVAFIVQKKGVLLFAHLDQLLEQKEFQAAKDLIEKVVELFAHCAKKGYDDVDAVLEKNYGVIDNHPFILDFGRLNPLLSSIPLKEYVKCKTGSLEEKIKIYPELLDHYQKLIEKL